MALVTSNISGSAKATSARSGDGDTLRHGGVGLTGSLYIASAQEGTAKSQGGIIFGKVAANITPGTSSGSLFCKNVAGSAQLFWYDGSTATNLVAGSSIDGSGAANRMTYWTDSNTLSSIDDLIYNGTDLQVGNGDDTKLYFRDGGIYIFSDANGDLSLVADDQIKLSATGSIPITVGAAGVVIQGTTPKLTIGDAGAEDTFLVFDGNAQDYRIGLDDGTDKLEIGVGATHGTTTAITVDSSQLVAMQAAATVGTTLGVTGISTFTADLVCNGGDITNGTTGNANNIFATSTGKVTLGGGAIDLSATGTATTVKGTLNVDEAVTLDSTLDVTGDTSVSTFDSTGASTLASGGGVVAICSTGVMTTVKGTLNVDEAVTLDSTLDVTGDTSVSTFDSSGATTLASGGGAVTIGSTGVMTTIEGTLNVDEAVTLDTTLGVTGISTFTADLVCNGGDITNGTTGNANNIFATSTGKVTLGGGAIDLGATSTATTVKGTLNVDEAVTLDTTLGCAGAVDFDTTLNVDGASTMGAITSDGAISTTSTLGVGGLATMGNVDIGGGNIDGTTIGAAVVAAGSFAAVVGTTATFSSTLTANGDVDLGDATGDTITATGRFDSDLVPSTDSARDLGTSVLQWADIHADAGYIDAMTITGDIGVGGTATFGGNVDLGNAIMDTVTFVARVDSNIVPSSDSAQDLGTSVLRWNNIYTGDLHLANDRGNYTMVEEEDMLTIRNNRTGKWYRMMMEEIDPSGRDDGMKGPAPVLAGDTDWEV